MLWTVAGLLTAVGFVFWIVGSVFNYVGISMIGAVVIMATGAMVVDGGLEFEAGETQITESSEVTEIEYNYEQVDTPTQLSLGGLVMLAGGLLAIQKLTEVSF